MKTKKTLGLVAATLTALACALPRTVAAGGDIVSIDFYGNPEGEVGVVNDLSRPLVAGDKVQFRIRLLNRGYEETFSHPDDPAYLNPWMLRSLLGAGSISNRLPRVGVRVSGGLKYADIVSWKQPESVNGVDGSYFTDLVCRYTVEAGDFAIPLKLANTSGKAAAMEGDANNPGVVPEESSYYLTEDNLWGFFPKNPADNVTENRLEFYFGPELSGWLPSKAGTVARDYNLSQANIQIMSVDFDDDPTAGDGIWRNISAGQTSASPAPPRIKIPGGPSGTYTYYVWTRDPDVMEVEGGTDYTFKDTTGAVRTHKVAAVTVTAGDQPLWPFVLRAKPGMVGSTTEVYMSDTPTNICNRSGVLLTNFTTRVVKVVDPPPPSISVVLDPASGTATTSTNNYIAVATLDVNLSEAVDYDVTVLITPTMKSGSGVDPFTYIGMSTAMSGAEYYDGEVKTLTVKAGKTSASESASMLYVYGNRANDDTAKGIRFTPAIDPASPTAAQAEAHFTGERTPATLQLNSNVPVITMPEEGTEYYNIPANTPYDFTIKVADAMWDLHGKTPGDGKYTVFIDYNGSGNYEPIPNLTANASGEITFPYRYVVGGCDYTSKIYVVNQDGVSSGRENARSYKVHVKVAKKVVVTPDHEKKTYCEGETAEFAFTFSESFDYEHDAFVFLEPADAQSRDLVECDAFTYGIPISSGESVPSDSAKLRLKDGWKNCAFRYNVVVRSTDDPDDDTNIISVWGSEGITIYSTNTVPNVLSVSMNDTPIYESGMTFESVAAAGVQCRFDVAAWDESYDVDLVSNAFETVVKVWESGTVVKNVTLHGNPDGQTILHTFSKAGVNKITVHVYDKDMTPAERLLVDKDPFTVYVKTVDAPAISLSPYNSSIYFNESDIGNKRGLMYVDLNVPPTLSGTDTITVHLDVQRNAPDNGNYTLPELDKYDITFKNGETHKEFWFTDLDGTPLSSSKGFKIVATCTTTTTSPDATKTWAEYYEACNDFVVYVDNEKPEIGPGAATTNEVPVAINVPYTIEYTVDDIPTDQHSMKVTWTYNGGSETETIDVADRSLTKAVTFTSSGSKRVTLVVKDKDGGLDTREFFFYVAPSKILEIHPRQPNRLNGVRDAVSAFSKKYTSALGIGDGRVWANGADAPTEVSSFTHKWSYSPEDLKTTVFARGYKIGDVDNGSLLPARDVALDANGNWHVTAAEYANYYAYLDEDGKDSFFYCWIANAPGGDNGGYAGSHLNGTVQPEVGPAAKGQQEVVLPEYDESAVTYEPVVLEAIFSLEYLVEDNVGDINQDGIPDIYAADTEWQGGTLVTAAGFAIDDESPGDLKNLAKFNTEEGDFLPAKTATGASLIPNVANWAKLGGEFTALQELRGFDEHLNFRVSDSGYNRNVKGVWVSVPTFSPAETNAIAHHAGIALDDDDFATKFDTYLQQSNSWIPENRTDPTVPDTDGDGFPDGFEYYFWYSAEVGTINGKGEWERLEGSRFSLKDIATGEKITPEEIAAAFNPTVPSGVDAEKRDTDNDGLTDLEELSMGLNPVNWDTDGDGLSDYWEVMNGMNPLSAAEADGAAMNADGDFMARWDSGADYAILTLPDGREFALGGNYATLFESIDEESGEAKFAEAVRTNNQITAISVFRYGKAGKGVCVPRFRGGSVTNTVDEFGVEAEAKPLDALVWELGDATNEDVTVTVKVGQKIALVHDQVYAQFGFDPRTGWFRDANGFVASRWNPTTKGAEYEGASGEAVNTVKYTALDEYLLLKYRYETNKESPTKLINWANDKKPWTIEDDEARWGKRKFADVLLQGTTCPNVPFEAPSWLEDTDVGEMTFASELHGADTDKDGVPDGWELYVGQNPNSSADDDTKDMDGDKLGLAAEYAGTDSCNAYSGCDTVISNHPGIVKGWYNKFFPTDPHNGDTDGDGIDDGKEGSTWISSFKWGNGAVRYDRIATDYYEGSIHTFTFIYGPNEGKPEGDDGSTCIRGGGLNPCSVDTDGDALPDPWEREFAGVVFGPSGTPEGGLTIGSGTLTLIRRGDGLDTGDSAKGYYITAGMDGTFGWRPAESDFTGDAFTNARFVDPATGTHRDMDFDHDGLQNFQEYLVQALRHLRYDDAKTPLMGSWMPSGEPASRKFVGFLPMNIMDGETFYNECKSAGFVATGAWDFRTLGYFARPPHEWDKTALNTYPVLMGGPNYDETGFRVMLPPALNYCSTDPRNWDTDGDGMDDYYELFHGLNPLLGEVKGEKGYVNGHDIISVSYLGMISCCDNAWTAGTEMTPDNPVYDAMRFPWMMGAPGADADGDGIRNFDEALVANLTSPQPSHTDPTPLWMTDSSALNKASFTAQYYKMDDDAVDVPDFAFYPAWNADASSRWMFSFEENEGYDTDHDGISDSEEKRLTSTALTDPLDYTDPIHRQALWFPGDRSAAVSYQCPPSRTTDLEFDVFRQFTVEAWMRPEDNTRAQVLIERAVVVGADTLSNNVSQVRANFRIGISAEGQLYGMYDTSDAVPSGTTGSSVFVYGGRPETNVWTHVAVTFDGARLALYVNGKKSESQPSSLIPANGVSAISQQPLPGGDAFPAGSDFKCEPRVALVLGARALDEKGVVLSGESSWNSYGEFYAGYLDEVRVWDGVRGDGDIEASYKTRFTVEDVTALRQEVYSAWRDGATRNDVDGRKMLPAELVFHYNFQNIPGAVDPADVMWEPSGFTAKVLDQVRVDGEEIPGDLYCGWWKSLPVHSTVYRNYRWVPWMPNMVAHLPALDGSTADSRYWGTNLAGLCAAAEAEVESFVFPNTMNPYSLYNVQSGADFSIYHNRLGMLAGFGDNFSELYRKWRFQVRTCALGSSDLLPLGGAFAKRSEDFWDGLGASDAWAHTGDDFDGNGIPDWWQNIAIGQYGAPDGFTWDSLVDYHGVQITAREAYIRDLAIGLQPDGSVDAAYASTADVDNDDLPDWWENLYNIFPYDGQDDNDNDGLDNRAEFVISELLSPYGFPVVKPTQVSTFATSGQLVPDYFLPMGKLYLGEMFSDHDFMEDAWEDQFESAFISRAVYDAWKDADDDGWSNFAECRALTNPTRVSYPSIDSTDLAAYPVPVVKAHVVYNGSDTFQYPIVFQAWSEQTGSAGMPDAVWKVGKSSAENKTSSNNSDEQNEAATGVQKSKIIGLNPGSKLTLHLGPGSVEPGSVKILFKDPVYGIYTYTYYNGVLRSISRGFGSYDGAVWISAGQDVFTAEGQGSIVLSYDQDWASNASSCGSIDYQTGEVMIDFAQMDATIGSLISDQKSTSGDTEIREETRRRTDMANSYVKIMWKSRTATSATSATFYLSDADAPTKESKTRGFLREGRNTFAAFLDVNGDGAWTPGEPYGVARNVDVGWSSANFELELTDTSPILARYNVTEAFGAGDFAQATLFTDRGVIGSYYDNAGVYYVGTNALNSGTTRVRVVRTAINDSTTGANGVVYDERVDLASHPNLTEADILAKSPDLDWDTLSAAWKASHGGSANMTSLVKVDYRVVLGDGPIIPDGYNNNIAARFCNAFEQGTAQTKTVPDAAASQLVFTGSPVFRWRHDPLDADGRRVKDYPAFQCRIWDESGALVWESDVMQAPARDSRGYYSWTAPVNCGMVTKFGKEFTTTNSYTWAVSMLDAKFTKFSAKEDKTPFRLVCSGDANDDAGAGTILVKVKYFGPLVDSLSASPSALTNLIHVEAFTTPDFSGTPVGCGYVKDLVGINSPSNLSVNAYIRGLPEGTYYVRAYIDGDADFERDNWESWGYVNYVGYGDIATIYTPRSCTVKSGAKVPEVQLYIEDVDTDGDGLPDGWEMTENGDLKTGGAATGGTYYARVNSALASALTAYAQGGISGISAEEFAAWPILNVLKGLDGMSGMKLSAAFLMNQPVSKTTAGLRIESFSLESGFVISAETETKTENASGSGAALQSVSSPEPVMVAWELLYTEDLGSAFKPVEGIGGVIPVGREGKASVDFDDAVLRARIAEKKSGFFKVRVTNVTK